MGSVFILTLANIFMWKWEKQVVHRLFVNDIFFICKDTLESIDQILDKANNFHPNIKLNSNGTLKTSVYHREAAERYVVPFGSDRPSHVFRNTVDTDITRTVRYSTTLAQFEEEIRQMKLMFLYNSKYLSKHFILPMLNGSNEFGYLRHQLLTTSTATTYDKSLEAQAAKQRPQHIQRILGSQLSQPSSQLQQLSQPPQSPQLQQLSQSQQPSQLQQSSQSQQPSQQPLLLLS
ncbi:unnamed protein product [Rotaria socialis]|uniref:Helix-turn-helix domain-containing protein n=1 Tax=Rotaria socialis TaxID=392032 RepID=A0A818VSM1_9BILA|nr:unnamed protein product [Rotaria socialis]